MQRDTRLSRSHLEEAVSEKERNSPTESGGVEGGGFGVVGGE